MITKTEELSIVIDKILEQRQTGKKVQRQQILRECKKAGLQFLPKEGLGISSVMFSKKQAEYITEDLQEQINPIEVE